jgi:purine-binding chemotaxis protein CheW
MNEMHMAGDQPQYLTFSIADEEFAVEIPWVREIIEYDTLTRIPGTPPFVRGVFNLRGEVLPVIDLAVKFGFPVSAVTSRTCIIVVDVDPLGERSAMGVIADAVSEVIELTPDQMEEPPDFGTSIRLDFLKAMVKTEKKFTLLLDINRVLSAEELLAVSELGLNGDDGHDPCGMASENTEWNSAYSLAGPHAAPCEPGGYNNGDAT